MHQESCSNPSAPIEKGLKLFGVRILRDDEEVLEVMRKSQSMGNLASCEANPAVDLAAADHGYLSDGGLVQNSRRRGGGQERKRGVPWTEEEHRTFLAGLEKLGKGDWRGISRNFVTTKTPTQVASHAQKYFLRQSNPNKKKRRSSLFDVVIKDNATPTPPETPTKLSLKKNDGVAEETYHVSEDNHLLLQMGSQSVIAAQAVSLAAEASQALTLATNSISTPNDVHLMDGSSRDQKFQSKSATLTVARNFLQLSLPSCPAQPPAIESSDLELSIAPPRSHTFAKFPSQGAAGAIRVI